MSNNLKALDQTSDEIRLGNYIVLFGGKDLTGEHFTSKTHFDSAYTDLGVLYQDFEHGRDHERMGNSTDNVVGVVDWRTAKADEKGIFVERVLSRRAKYVRLLEELIDAGVVGTSSFAVGGSVRKKSTGEIIEWPLMRDSLTVTPMEPRMISSNVLTAAKSLAGIFPASKSLALFAGLPTDNFEDGLKAIEEIEDLKGAEKFLRDSGVSKRGALAFIAKVKGLSRSDSGEGEMKAVIEALKRRKFPL